MFSFFKMHKLYNIQFIISDGTSPSLTQVPPPSANGTTFCCGGNRKGGHHQYKGNWNRNRLSRSAPETPPNMEDKLKEFAAKLGKTPDELRAAFGKFMLAQGISLQQMQETLEHGNKLALQAIDDIKKAMHI